MAIVKPKEAILNMEVRGVTLPNDYYNVIQKAYRSIAFTITGLAKVAQIEQVLTIMQKSIDEGLSFKEFKKMFLELPTGAMLPKHRVDNIFRTNIQSSYMSGKSVSILELQDARPYLMYAAVGDERTRKPHLAQDGRVERVDSPFWSIWMPINGYMCRCTVISMRESTAKRYMTEDQKALTAKKRKARKEAKVDKGFDYSVLDRGLKETARRAVKAKKDGGIYDGYLETLGAGLG